MQKMQEQDRTKNKVASRRKGGEQDTNGNREDESRIPSHPPQIGAGQRRQQSEPSDEQEKNQSDAPKQKKMQWQHMEANRESKELQHSKGTTDKVLKRQTRNKEKNWEAWRITVKTRAEIQDEP